MFTGIIESLGIIESIEDKGGDARFWIQTGKMDMSDVQLGDSIAMNGVCLTAIELRDNAYCADVSGETLTLTSLKQLKEGSTVNLEKALTLQTRLGGHMVSGHVDGLGTVIDRYDDGRSVRFIIETPKSLAKYVAMKGSITVDGVSLTVNKVDGCQFELNIVPHTLQETIMGSYQSGSEVNLEVDLVARYLERLVLGDGAAKTDSESEITTTFLAENGFLK
ncbi:MAG: riboflavin synthase [endosymbiont of Galathealinum brachiosum]|uniref:Riboflavin synthase n=1 Tax=endosymbiont of Galathealinum brachiosum TaxID=2200906 RepID=A0A370DGK0_9GAMM|nr:MAG: riboflavin synthase [endosymbiont of Galathealinum brachiosum]